MKEELFECWAGMKPNFESHFREELFKKYTDYMHKASETTASKGKYFGPGYELYIYAFFIGLYSGQKRPLAGEKINLNHELLNWGNNKSSINDTVIRKPYPELKKDIFAALIATSDDVDWIALEKGEIQVKEVASMLVKTMEQYTNEGLYRIKDKEDENDTFFYSKMGFMNFLLETIKNNPHLNCSDLMDLEEEIDPSVEKPDSNIDQTDDFEEKEETADVDAVTEEDSQNIPLWHNPVDFEVLMYQKGSGFWHELYENLEDEEILPIGDRDYVHDISLLLSKNKMLTEKQVTRLYKIVRAAEKAGYKFSFDN